MSRKFMEAHASTGYTSKRVESKFGLKILEKMGWKEYEKIKKNNKKIQIQI